MPCFLKISAKKTSIAWPKIIGSETFIIVAFICNENNTPLFFASIISVSKNDNNAFLLISVASIISPANKGVFSFKTEVVPLISICSIVIFVSLAIVTDFSL